MFKRLSIRLAVTYGMVIVITITVIDIILIYTYQKNQFKKNEPGYLAVANMLSVMAGVGISSEDALNMMVKDYGSSIEGRILILDKNSIVLADSCESYKKKKITNNEIRKALRDKTSSIGYYYLDNKKVMMLAVPVYDKYETEGAVLISSYVTNIQEDINIFKKQVIWISMAVSFFSLVLSFMAGRNITSPIKRLTKASEDILKGVLNTRVQISRNDEIGVLGLTFNKMSEELYKIDINRRYFLSSVSHELKTPLASIKALIESLIDGSNDINTYNEYLSDVNHEIDRLSNLVGSLLTITRLDEMHIKKKKINAHEEICSVLKLFTPLMERKGIQATCDCREDLHIYADSNGFKEILINLIDNSIKYGKYNGFISISCKDYRNKTLITIEDNGYGIGEKDLKNIFDNFYRVEESRNRDKGGSGVGLYVVKRIVEHHGWSINVNSKPGEGTVFSITIS